MNDLFRRFSQKCASMMGQPISFVAATVLIFGWALLGPVCHFSDTWQLAINTLTTIVTFLMVFVIQSSQNRESLAIQLKLDELLRAMKQARTTLVRLEDWADEDLEELRQEFERISGRRPRQTGDAAHGPAENEERKVPSA